MSATAEAFSLIRTAVDDAESRIYALTRELRAAELDVGEGDSSPVEPNHDESLSHQARVEFALSAAELSFSSDIEEPPGAHWQLIDERIRGEQGLGWSWEKPYKRDGQFLWCGAEAAYCWGAARLLPDIRKRVMPSCYRLWRHFQVGDRQKRRLVPIEQAQPGDIVVTGSKSGRHWGSHITILLELDLTQRRAFVHEGNATTYGPTGKRREGVGRQWYSLDHKGRHDHAVMFVYRFLDEDFEGA